MVGEFQKANGNPNLANVALQQQLAQLQQAQKSVPPTAAAAGQSTPAALPAILNMLIAQQVKMKIHSR